MSDVNWRKAFDEVDAENKKLKEEVAKWREKENKEFPWMYVATHEDKLADICKKVKELPCFLIDATDASDNLVPKTEVLKLIEEEKE